jgi:hypothetical protein
MPRQIVALLLLFASGLAMSQFAGLFTTARFDRSGRPVDSNFGAFNSARTPRIIRLSLKVIF